MASTTHTVSSNPLADAMRGTTNQVRERLQATYGKAIHKGGNLVLPILHKNILALAKQAERASIALTELSEKIVLPATAQTEATAADAKAPVRKAAARTRSSGPKTAARTRKTSAKPEAASEQPTVETAAMTAAA